MNRSLAKAGSQTVALACALALGLCASARAATAQAVPMSFWFGGARLSFDRPQLRAGALAVGIDDAGFGKFLHKLNATVSYQPGQKYVFITTGDRRTVTFALGDASVTVDGLPQAAAFAPYVVRSSVFVPFVDLARALAVVPVNDGSTTVLQPQISSVEVKTDKGISIVTIYGAGTLQFKRANEPGGERIAFAFAAGGAALDASRAVAAPGLRGISATVGGTTKNPTTVLTFDAPTGATHAVVPTTSPNTVEIAFAPPGVALEGANAAPASAAPVYGTQAPTATTLAPASITALTTDATDATFNVHLSISGPVTYEWHRLADFRWYVDFKPATLAIEPQDTSIGSTAITSLRIKPFVGPNDKLDTVRVGMTLPSPRSVSLVPTASGLTISVGSTDDANRQISGTGELASGQLLAIVPLPAPPPLDATPQPWKFDPGLPTTGVRNSRLIVIDPGHGGSDAGAVHNGMNEKDLTLDMSRRLRAALIARGWQVKLTRESDVDVFAANDSAHDELQARDDIANNAGARLLISVHVNAFTKSYLNGTTTYYYKDDSLGFATAIHARLARSLPTADDGIRKENFYVIHHSNMPSILIETAFVSNPGDAALLRTDAFRDQVAQAIAAGVGDFAKPGSAASPIMDGQ